MSLRHLQEHSQGAAGSSEAMEETDSTEVKYKIRQWSLPGATIVPVLNVSSRVFWLELDDKALLDSYAVLQEGILCDVFSQKCSAAWQGARGERLTVGIMLPGRQDADDWLNFMLSQKNLWPTFTTRGTLTEEISEQVFSKERRRLQARHCGWWSSYGGGCLLTECTSKPPPGSPKKNWMLCSLTGPPDATAQTHMKRKSIVGLESKKSRHGGSNARIGWHTLKNKVNRLSLTSRSCWWRYQTRKQWRSRKLMHLWRIVQKGGRLGRARINSSDDVWSQTLGTRLSIQGQILIWLTFNYWTWRSTTRWTRTYEGLRGARMFHLVSLSLQISLNVLPGPCLGLCVGVACFVGFVGLVVGFFLWGNLISITGSFQLLTDHVSHLSGNAGKKKRIMRPRKSNNRTLRNDKSCSWRGQFELGNPWYTNESMTDFAQDGILLQVGMGGCVGLFGAYSLIPPLASVADPRPFDPRVGDDKTYITTMGMQQTSVHGRTTSCCKTGWENRTWWSPSPSSGFTTWPQWKERSFFQDHLWVIWTMEAGITTFLWFLVCALWLLLSQWLSCLVQFHLRGRGWTNFSPLFNDWDDTGPPPTCTSRLWVTWDIYMWDLLWHREAVLSGLGTFWKRSVSRSFLGVLLGCVGLVLVGLFCCFCVCVVWRHLVFCFHLFSNMWE